MTNNTPFFSDAAVIADVGAIAVLLNSGFLEIYTGTQPADANSSITGTQLAKLTFSATAFVSPAVASGSAGTKIVTATANAITSATASNTGTAGYFVLKKSDDTTVVAMGSCGATSGFDLNFDSTSITSGATVSCSSFTITQTE